MDVIARRSLLRLTVVCLVTALTAKAGAASIALAEDAGSPQPTTAAEGEATSHPLVLPSRPGSAPSVTDGIPHIQLDQTSGPAIMEALATWAFSHPSIVELPSATSLPGARAFTLINDLEANDDAMMVGREFGHIHAYPGTGSLHVRLPEGEASAVIDAGWGVWHPFAADGSMPGLIMVFAPRDLDDLEVIKLIVGASAEYAGG